MKHGLTYSIQFYEIICIEFSRITGYKVFWQQVSDFLNSLFYCSKLIQISYKSFIASLSFSFHSRSVSLDFTNEWACEQVNWNKCDLIHYFSFIRLTCIRLLLLIQVHRIQEKKRFLFKKFVKLIGYLGQPSIIIQNIDASM